MGLFYSCPEEVYVQFRHTNKETPSNNKQDGLKEMSAESIIHHRFDDL
jgi:hypothetical protein